MIGSFRCSHGVQGLIDLHCHLLPAIDDGATDIQVSLAMARAAVADGVRITACTPHIYPGLYENTRQSISAAITSLRHALAEEEIPLQIVIGADTHLVPGLLTRLRNGEVPTIADSAYLLLEPPHHIAPPGFEQAVFELAAAGYVPVITHPERLTWIGDHYEAFRRLVQGGAWMQVTAGSLTGRFGADARYWGERMLDEGLVHLLATDSHGMGRRPPLLAEGRHAAAKWVGAEEATRLVVDRPRCIINNAKPGSMLAPGTRQQGGKSWLSRLFA